jgi:hypothetical protein
MGTESERDFVVGVGPLGVVVHFLGDEGHAGHEREGFAEIPEHEGSGELVIFFLPHIVPTGLRPDCLRGGKLEDRNEKNRFLAESLGKIKKPSYFCTHNK